MLRSTVQQKRNCVREKDDAIARAWMCLSTVLAILQISLDEAIPWVRRISSVLGFSLFISIESRVFVPALAYAMHDMSLPDNQVPAIGIDAPTVVGMLLAISVFVLLVRHLVEDARHPGDS